jgi:hypothetical protein
VTGVQTCALPIYAHKQTRKTVCGELLAQYENGGDDIRARIVTGDETWLHHFEQKQCVLITATKPWIRRAGPEFCPAGIQALVPKWHKAVERDRDYVEK